MVNEEIDNISADTNHGYGWKSWALFAVVLLILWRVFGGPSKYEGKTAEEWFNQYDAVTAELAEKTNSLEEANANIKQCNENIEDAKYYEGSSYEDMENALNSLDTVDEVN